MSTATHLTCATLSDDILFPQESLSIHSINLFSYNTQSYNDQKRKPTTQSWKSTAPSAEPTADKFPPQFSKHSSKIYHTHSANFSRLKEQPSTHPIKFLPPNTNNIQKEARGEFHHLLMPR